MHRFEKKRPNVPVIMTNDEVLVLQADDKPKHTGDCDKEQKSSVNDDTCGVEKNSPPPSKSSSAIEIDMIDDMFLNITEIKDLVDDKQCHRI